MVLLVLVLLIDDYSQPTYSVPYSHIDPFATLQQRSSSSRTLLKRRALFCPRCAFFCSFVSLPRAGPWECPRVSRIARVAVLPAVACGASLCYIVVGDNLRSGRYQKSEQVINLQKNSGRRTHSAFTGAVPEGYCRGVCSTIDAPPFSIEMC